jgi:hypothetical protein
MFSGTSMDIRSSIITFFVSVILIFIGIKILAYVYKQASNYEYKKYKASKWNHIFADFIAENSDNETNYMVKDKTYTKYIDYNRKNKITIYYKIKNPDIFITLYEIRNKLNRPNLFVLFAQSLVGIIPLFCGGVMAFLIINLALNHNIN